MPSFTHEEGWVVWEGQQLEPAQAVALTHEIRDFADAAFFASDFDAYERSVDTRDDLLAAIQAANRWAEASA